MLPTLRDRPAAPRHEGLLAASAGHRRTEMSTWARAALDRREKLLTLCAPIDTDIANRAGSALTALTPEDLHSTAWPAELLQRARPDRHHGLGILVWADAVISATSRDTHVEIETTLAGLCRDHRVSVQCAPWCGMPPVRPTRRAALLGWRHVPPVPAADRRSAPSQRPEMSTLEA